MHAIQSEFVEANGLRFHVNTCGDPESEKLALCLHGFPELGYSWRDQLPLLADLGYRAWAPDLRGYGQTDRPPEMRDYALEPLMEDVAALIDASGAKSVLLLAHDWGAIIAWCFATRTLRALEGLVIMNVPHPAVIAEGPPNFRQRLRSWYILFFQLPWLPEWFLTLDRARAIGNVFSRWAVDKERFPPEVVDVYREAALQPGAVRAMVNYYRALVRGGSLRRQIALGFPQIETPTLVVWGEQDAALGKELTYDTGRHVRDLTLRYLPNASHWVQQDDPGTVNAMLTAWVGGDEVPQAPDA
ncbi:MAG: epoxide hydrolase [Deltaproteobacteria bacterium]|nr:epoxide hydrolase [Deltaproteobacteria bacterium]